MRPAERDVLLFALAVSAGSADAWSYFGFGHAFVANMTGNTVLLGAGIFLKGVDPRPLLIAMICYLTGAAVASLVTRSMPKGAVWPKAISWTLLLEGLVMAGAEAVWAMHVRAAPLPAGISSRLLHALLASVAFAIGLQSGAMLQLKIPGIVTTYITGTWTTLTSGVARLARSSRNGEAAEARQFEERALMQAGVLIVYFSAAAMTGWLFRHVPMAVGAVSALSVLLVAVYGMFRHSEDADIPVPAPSVAETGM